MASSTGMTRRKFFATAAAGTGAAVAGSTFPRPAIAQLVKVRYTLSWLPTGQYAFIYSARQLGYFKKRGIDLDISRGYGSMAAIQAVVHWTVRNGRRADRRHPALDHEGARPAAARHARL